MIHSIQIYGSRFGELPSPPFDEIDSVRCAAGDQCAYVEPHLLGLVTVADRDSDSDRLDWFAPFLHAASGEYVCEDCAANVEDGSLVWDGTTFTYTEPVQ